MIGSYYAMIVAVILLFCMQYFLMTVQIYISVNSQNKSHVYSDICAFSSLSTKLAFIIIESQGLHKSTRWHSCFILDLRLPIWSRFESRVLLHCIEESVPQG